MDSIPSTLATVAGELDGNIHMDGFFRISEVQKEGKWSCFAGGLLGKGGAELKTLVDLSLELFVE